MPGVLLVLGLVYRLIFIYRPLAWLTDYWLFEDWGYALKIAQNLAHGVGETFDGVVQTNGYQPLYVWLLAPVCLLFEAGSPAPVYIALTMLAVCDVLTALFLYGLLNELGARPFWKYFGLCFWLFNPCVARAGTNGLETGLAMSLCALFLLLALRAYNRQELFENRTAVTLGLVFALAFLARVDALFLGFAFGLFLFRSAFGPAGGAGVESAGGRRDLLRFLPRFAVPVLGITGPYLLHNLWWYGSALPASGAVVAGRKSLISFPAMPDPGQVLEGLKGVAFLMAMMLRGAMTVTGYRPYEAEAGERVFVVTAALACLAAFVLLFVRQAALDRRHWLLILTLALYVYGYSVYIPFVSFERYFIMPVFLIAALLCAVMSRLDGHLRSRALLGLLLSAGVAGAFVHGVVAHTNRGGQRFGWYLGISRLNEMLPQGTTVAGLQSGNLGYLYRKGRAVNLDGVVNREAYRYRFNGDLYSYIRKERVGVIADEGGWAFRAADSMKHSADRNAYLFSLQLLHNSRDYWFSAFRLEPVRYERLINADERHVRLSGPWERRPDKRMVEGDSLMSSARGSRMMFTSARSFVLKCLRHDWSGIAGIYRDGALVEQIDLYSPTQDPTYRYHYVAPDSKEHEYALELTGEKNRKSMACEVWVDAIAELKP